MESGVLKVKRFFLISSSHFQTGIHNHNIDVLSIGCVPDVAAIRFDCPDTNPSILILIE